MINSILFLGTQMAVGGAQQVLLDQANWFHQKGNKVTAVFLYDKEGLNQHWQDKHSYPIINLSAYNPQKWLILNSFVILRGVIRLWRLLRNNGFDVIETFTPHSNLLGIPVAKIAKVKVLVATYHGQIERFPWWLRYLHSWVLNLDMAHRLVVVSDHLRNIAIKEGVISEKIEVIKNGIVLPQVDLPPDKIRAQIQEELGLERIDHIILSVGRVTTQKGHAYLLEAVPTILEQFTGAVFIVAGEGPLKSMLQERAIQLGVARNIHFVGTRSDIPRLLSTADIFVMPSLSEGLPIALLEAMGMGIPVVASKLEGIAAVIENERQGLIVEPGDAQAIATSVIRLLKDRNFRESLGQSGKELVQKDYTIDQMCSRYERLFQILSDQEKDS